MAGSYNRVVLVGNLTRDPEIRYVQSGSAVTKFTLAVNRKSKGNDETTFVDIVAWDNGNYKLAETCNTYLKKGMSALVEGRLVIRSYEDKDGNKRKATEVVIDNMQMLDRATTGTPGSSSGAGSSSGTSARPTGGSTGSTRDSTQNDRYRHTSSAGLASDGLDEAQLDDEIPFRTQPPASNVRWWLR